MKRPGNYNRIWLPVAFVLTLLLGMVSFKDVQVQAMALEQQARCGIAEHTHREDCYTDGVLTCDTAVHTHRENCYLVLLKDNDINTLLAQMEQQPDNALETVIDRSVDSALQFNQDLTSPLAAQDVLSADVAAINETIEEYDINPQVTLNENLYTSYGGYDGDLPLPGEPPDRTTMEASPEGTWDPLDYNAPPGQIPQSSGDDPLLYAQPEDSLLYTDAEDPLLYGQVDEEVSLLDLDDPVQTGASNANYYVYLDNGWRTVGTLKFSTSRSGIRYSAYESTTEIQNLYNDSLGLDLTASDIVLNYATSPTSRTWTRATTSGSNTYFGTNYNRQNTAQNVKYVRLVDSSGDPLAFYTVTLRYLDGREVVRYVRSGTAFSLPQEAAWSEGTTEYAGGDQVTVYSARTFTERISDGKVRISYTVNFPTVSGVTISTKPTILGSTETELTDVIEVETDARIRNVSQQNVVGKVNNHSAGLSRVVGFMGWQIEGTDTVLSANATLTWAELQAYTGGKNMLKLVGVWESRAQQTASFYIRYDSVAVDTEGNMTSQDANKYTPELYAAFVGGDDAANLSVNDLNSRYYIADTSSDNSYGADQEIRSLYGQTSGLWLQSFPKDEDIFEMLKDYASHLQVDGKPVDVNDLNEHGYTIRWYVFKAQSDAWHVDGRLVKKEGYLDVTKSFAGNRQAIEEAMEGFRITAVNAAGDKKYYLYLEPPQSPPRDGTVLTPTGADGLTYYWTIAGVDYGEQWYLDEDVGVPAGADMVAHSSYRVVDAYNLQNKAGDGTSVDVTGMTYDTDMGEIQALRVEFTNIYHPTDSVIIKKEDDATGSPLGGAVFSLKQNDEFLRFTYDGAEDRYLYDPGGQITELTGNG